MLLLPPSLIIFGLLLTVCNTGRKGVLRPEFPAKVIAGQSPRRSAEWKRAVRAVLSPRPDIEIYFTAG